MKLKLSVYGIALYISILTHIEFLTDNVQRSVTQKLIFAFILSVCYFGIAACINKIIDLVKNTYKT